MTPSLFLSTLPARGATAYFSITGRQRRFLSTLPARGATCSMLSCLTGQGNFYPRSPRGERRRFAVAFVMAVRFLSTLPARGATVNLAVQLPAICNFYPRSPRGERHTPLSLICVSFEFLSTLPARGATRDAGVLGFFHRVISIHAPREGSDYPYS